MTKEISKKKTNTNQSHLPVELNTYKVINENRWRLPDVKLVVDKMSVSGQKRKTFGCKVSVLLMQCVVWCLELISSS